MARRRAGAAGTASDLLLARLRRLHPDLPQAAQIAELFHGNLTPQNILVELAYLDRPESRGFERPYGWAWLLMLAAEFSRHTTAEGQLWTATLRPLADAFAARLVQFLPKAIYAIRTGTHSNTAFAITLAWEYATVLDDEPLRALLAATALSWYGRDVDCQAWEPSLDDFLSPALIEAECMRRILPADRFHEWMARFLPRLEHRQPATLFEPATISDRTDGKIAHLDGLNLSRAWCWRAIAADLTDETLSRLAHGAADQHLEASLPHITGDYMGEHWLATFALLALSSSTPS